MMTLKQSRRVQSALLGTLAWIIALVIFFPIFWMILTSFKTEIDAFATPPQFFFTPTLENYLHIQERSDYFHFAWNSVLISAGVILFGRRALRRIDVHEADATEEAAAVLVGVGSIYAFGVRRRRESLIGSDRAKRSAGRAASTD